MKKTESFKNYQSQMELKQNIALLIEALQVLMRPEGTNSIESSRYQIDIVQNLLSTLFDDLQNYIIQNGINIDLNSTFIEGFYEALKEQDDDIMASRKTLNRYRKMEKSFHNLRLLVSESTINIITLLIDKGFVEEVVELIVSGKIPMELKREIMEHIVYNHFGQLNEIFDRIPASDCDYDDYDIEYRKQFKELLDQNLKAIFNDPLFIKSTIRNLLMTKYCSENEKNDVLNAIEFFVKHNLIDMNSINWLQDKQIISSAAAGYIMGNNILGRYLYSLPTYKQLDPTIRQNSDIAIMEALLKRPFKNELIMFLQSANFESTPEKLNRLMQIIVQDQPSNPNIIDIEIIIGILLRKTKKKDYKAMKKAIEDLKTNVDIDLLNKKRQELTRKLRTINDSLLDQYPATRVIKSLNLTMKDKRDSTK